MKPNQFHRLHRALVIGLVLTALSYSATGSPAGQQRATGSTSSTPVTEPRAPASLPPVVATPSNKCAFDSNDLATSVVTVNYRDKASLLPWKLDFDTGHHPASVFGVSPAPLQLKTFFYASAGEKDIKLQGDLEASWIAALACPGNTLDVGVKFTGNSQNSDWTTAFGIKGGVRYKIDANIGKFWYRRVGYVPKMPRIRFLGLGCTHEKPLPPAFSTQAPICFATAWAGNLDCFLTVPSVQVNCAISNAYLARLNFGIKLRGRLVKPATDGPEILCSPGFWVHPTTEMFFCLRPGLCTSFEYEGKSLTEETFGNTIVTDTDTLTAPVKIPCDFAQARNQADGPQLFDFTLGPFRMEGDWILTLWTKAEPILKTRFVKMVQVSFKLGKALCLRIAPNSLLNTRAALSFNKPKATFQMEIVEPRVCDIVPGAGDFVTATSLTTVTWTTTWGAPDACNCRVKLQYRVRPQGLSNFGPWLPMHTEEDIPNDGTYDFAFPETCNEGQVRVEFRDPGGQPLDVLIGGKFFITPVPARIEPYSIGFGNVLVGESADRDVTITNTGQSPLPLTIASPCPNFTITSGGGPQNVPVASAHTFTVRYQPVATGQESCVIATGLCPVTARGNATLEPILGSGRTRRDIGIVPSGRRESTTPTNFLDSAYPNPFNPSTTIRFGVESGGHVRLKVYDAAGRLVRTLVDEATSPGAWITEWHGVDDAGNAVASGVYFYRLVVGDYTETRKMILLK